MGIREKIIEKLSFLLSHNDHELSLKVEELASQIAKNFNIDENKTSIAALLLNYGKFINADELNSTAKDIGIDIENYKHDEEKLYAVVGAEIAKYDFDIEDEKILDVIKNQNQPSEDFSDLQKVVFIANTLNSDYVLTVKDEVEEALIEKDLEKAFKLSAESFLQKETIENYEIYQEEKEEEIEEESDFLKQETQAEVVLKRHRGASPDSLKRKKKIKLPKIKIPKPNLILNLYFIIDKLKRIKAFLIIVSILLITIILTAGLIWVVDKYFRQNNKNTKTGQESNITKETSQKKIYVEPLSLVLFYNQNNTKKAAIILFDEFLKKSLIINMPGDLVINIPGFGFKDVNTLIDKTEPETATMAISNQLAIKVYHYVTLQQQIFDLRSEQVLKSIFYENNPSNISSVERVDFYNKIKDKKINIIMTTIPQRKLEIEGKSFSQIKNDQLEEFYLEFELSNKLYIKDRKSVGSDLSDKVIIPTISFSKEN